MGRTHRSRAAGSEPATETSSRTSAPEPERLASAYGIDHVAEPVSDTPTLDLARVTEPVVVVPDRWDEPLEDGDYAAAVARVPTSPEPAVRSRTEPIDHEAALARLDRGPTPTWERRVAERDYAAAVAEIGAEPLPEHRSVADAYGVDPSTWELDGARPDAPSPPAAAPGRTLTDDAFDRIDAAERAAVDRREGELERLGNRDADEAFRDLAPDERATVAAFDPSRAAEHGRGAVEVEDDGAVTARVGSVASPEAGAAAHDASLGSDGELGVRRRRRDGDVTTTTSGTVDVLDGELGASVSRRTGSGATARTDAVTAGADVGLDGVSGVTVGASAAYPGGRKLTTSWGYDVDIAAPVYDAGRWRIDGTLTWTGSVGASHEAEGSDTLAGSLHVGQTRRFTRYFADQPTSRAWFDRAHEWFGVTSWAEFGEVDTVSEVTAMAVGDQSETTTEVGLDVSDTVEVSAVSVGATFGFDDRHLLRVTRSDAGHVRLRVEDRDVVEVGGTLSAGRVGWGATARGGDYAGREVEFDLTSPALQPALRTGELPRGAEGPGWRETERSDGETSGTTERVNLGVATMTYGAEVEDGYVDSRDAETGEVTRRHRVAGTGTMGAEASLPDWLVEGTRFDDAATSTRFTSTEGRGATIVGSVGGSDAADTHAELARATGAASHLDGVTGADSGTWTVRESLSEADLRAFLRSVHSREVLAHAHLFGAGAGAVEGLVADVRACGGLEAARSVLGSFFATHRERAMALVRATLGGEAPTPDVSLVGSDVFEGAAGRDRIASRLTALESHLGRTSDGLAAVTAELGELRLDQERRLGAMRDPERFRDLPPDLRDREITLNQELLDRCEDALREARARAGTTAEADADYADTALAAELDPAGAAVLSANSRTLLASLAADERRMNSAREPFLHAREVAEREHGVHRGDAGVHFAHPAREGLTLGWDPLGLAENDAYATADGAWSRGNAATERARSAFSAFQAAREASPAGLLDDAESARVQSMREHAWRAHDAYVDGTRAFAEAVRVWSGIRQRHPGAEYWGGTPAPEPITAPE